MDEKLDIFEDVPGVSLEGDMAVPSGAGNTRNTTDITAPDFNTLDEPIRETIYRDLRAVGVKFYYVLYPKEKLTLMRDWDLWGPLLLCTFLATMLHGSGDSVHDGGPEFAQVFVIVWIGAVVVTMNSKLLGGNISFFQSTCVLGYCLTPVALALIVCRIISLASQTSTGFFLRLLSSMLGCGWSTYASVVFLGDSQPPNRKPLAVYPIFLFFFIVSWMVVSKN